MLNNLIESSQQPYEIGLFMETLLVNKRTRNLNPGRVTLGVIIKVRDLEI